MPIIDPGTLEVCCDGCDKTEPFDTATYTGGEGTTFGVDDQTLEDQDWVRDGDETYCPACTKKRNGDE